MTIWQCWQLFEWLCFRVTREFRELAILIISVGVDWLLFAFLLPVEIELIPEALNADCTHNLVCKHDEDDS